MNETWVWLEVVFLAVALFLLKRDWIEFSKSMMWSLFASMMVFRFRGVLSSISWAFVVEPRAMILHPIWLLHFWVLWSSSWGVALPRLLRILFKDAKVGDVCLGVHHPLLLCEQFLSSLMLGSWWSLASDNHVSLHINVTWLWVRCASPCYCYGYTNAITKVVLYWSKFKWAHDSISRVGLCSWRFLIILMVWSYLGMELDYIFDSNMKQTK